MQTAVIIVAAGRGTRMGGAVPKQWQTLAGKPVLAHVLDAFAGLPLVLVIHPEDRERASRLGDVRLVHGGETRGASVLAGLQALAGSLRRISRIRAARRTTWRWHGRRGLTWPSSKVRRRT